MKRNLFQLMILSILPARGDRFEIDYPTSVVLTIVKTKPPTTTVGKWWSFSTFQIPIND